MYTILVLYVCRVSAPGYFGGGGCPMVSYEGALSPTGLCVRTCVRASRWKTCLLHISVGCHQKLKFGNTYQRGWYVNIQGELRTISILRIQFFLREYDCFKDIDLYFQIGICHIPPYLSMCRKLIRIEKCVCMIFWNYVVQNPHACFKLIAHCKRYQQELLNFISGIATGENFVLEVRNSNFL